MSKAKVMQCPTAISAVLLRLYALEEKVKRYDPMDMAWWWMLKLDELDDGKTWFDGRLWRLYARHIHALAVVNTPDVADGVANTLGIGSPQITQPVILATDGEDADPLWVLSDHFYAPAPFNFHVWQKPLRLRRPIPLPTEVDLLPADIDPSQVRPF